VHSALSFGVNGRSHFDTASVHPGAMKPITVRVGRVNGLEPRPESTTGRKTRMSSLICKKSARPLFMAAIAMLIAGCGGGGESGPPPAPYVPPVEPPAVVSVPPAVYTDNRRTLAFNRLNEIRAQAGVGLLAQSAPVDQAAQSHSVYQLVNSELGHTEAPNKPGYIGSTSHIRIEHFGYKDLVESTEVTARLAFPNSSLPQAGANLVDYLMGGPYHRSAIIQAEYADVGVGLYDKDSSTVLTVNFARTKSNTQGAPDTVVIIWPPDGSTDLPTAMLGETPNPIKENNGAPAGYPASVQVSSLWHALDVTRFEIRETSTGTLVDTKLLSYATDYELNTTFADHSFAAALPRAPLAKKTNYTVIFEGIKTMQNSLVSSPVRKTWSFTTGDKVEF
jgi:uncharacterized protein YkwD